MSIFTIALFLIAVSQFYWAWRGLKLSRKWIARSGRRWTVIALVLLVYAYLWVFNFGMFRRPTTVYLTWRDALLVAPFMTWAVASFFGALIALLFAIPQSIVGLARRIEARRQPDGPKSPARRVFLERTANVVYGKRVGTTLNVCTDTFNDS